VPNVFIRIKNSDQTATVATSDVSGTDVNGKEIFSLDAATYKVYCDLPGYNQDTIPQTIAFASGGGFDTLTMTSISPTLADSAGLCRVYGYVQTLFGVRVKNASVEFTPSTESQWRYGNSIYLGTTRGAMSNSSGYFEMYVTPSVKALPDTSANIYDTLKYDINLKYFKPTGELETRQIGRNVIIPDSSSLNLPRWLLP
jgi:hypothetical protein